MPAGVTLPQRPQVLGAEEQNGACERSVSFEDISMDVSREEWQQPDPAQRRLYQDVMREVYSHLFSGVSHSQPRDCIQDRKRKGAMDGEG
ncbi:hypothetical protein MUG91_G265n10 [Manis pentadactyla]|nr:hypothetical protein MUG91_G265n10 [Manis pentadactyla]